MGFYHAFTVLLIFIQKELKRKQWMQIISKHVFLDYKKFPNDEEYILKSHLFVENTI